MNFNKDPPREYISSIQTTVVKYNYKAEHKSSNNPRFYLLLTIAINSPLVK